MSGMLSAYKNKILRKFFEQKDLHPSALRHIKTVDKINREKPITETQFIVFDTELTGLNLKHDSIVSIGAVKMKGMRIDLSKTYYRIVEPTAKLTGKSVVIHGITPAEASLSPKIDLLLPEFLDFCGNGIIVGHFVPIDLEFINKVMVRMFGFPMQSPAVDTQKIYIWIRKNEEKLCAFHAGMREETDLFSLASKYAIPVKEAHNALNDAFITAQLFQRFISMLLEFGVQTVDDLLRIGNPRKTE